MAEFNIIQQYFNFEQKASESIVKAIGDDCAILEIPKSKQLVTSVDTLVAGVHFYADVSPRDLAYKALAVNVSDLLAMGANPLAYTLAITLPENDKAWLEAFSQSLKDTSEKFSINLIGGDTTQGPLSISIQVFGLVTKHKAVLRSGAQVYDDVWITGTLGSARTALDVNHRQDLNEFESSLWNKLVRPEIPYHFAKKKFSKFASAAIDISDGLYADLSHILNQSQLGAEVMIEALPLDEALIEVAGIEQARQFALNGGDDYQLCFTAHKDYRNKIHRHADKTNTRVTRIGKITAEKNSLKVLLNKDDYEINQASWQHFLTTK
ncbi:thiamine-phosphate kinase [Kangiella sp. HZ709]|uniref:thiamine-phosphate kinase n=1 Tax=Kangiella sp. HZ709 TaxID=2666328 RepID=UPI0012AF01E2|nr:thiamine-phosphate kinase [Kangiella sp. HZ709]MRX28676.1 thiamine-phosphate kinase [Kangiella sp. HZ709]